MPEAPPPHPDADPNPPTGDAEYRTDAELRPRDVRRLAVQALYTLDAMYPEAPPDAEQRVAPGIHSAAAARAALRKKSANDADSDPNDESTDAPGQPEAPDPEALLEALEEPFDDGESEVPVEPKVPAVELALAAWEQRREADAQCSQFAPDWPSHRQPPMDRAILRLAWFEMTTGRVDAALAINEAVELASQFSDEKAPPFINGILDRVAKRLPDHLKSAGPGTDDPTSPTSGGGDPWLNDAVQR
ncbi:MAG: transcription antitermination protein NusB [Planctomycetota bacterium]